MCGGSKNKSSGGGSDDYTAPDPSPTVQSMIEALTYGPTGYSDDMMKNLGMDTINPGFQGGARPVSAMTTFPVNGYQPRAVTPDPLQPALARGPATPVTTSDLFMNYGRTSEKDDKK